MEASITEGNCDHCGKTGLLPTVFSSFSFCSKNCMNEHIPFMDLVYKSQVGRETECWCCGRIVDKKKMVIMPKRGNAPPAAICSQTCYDVYALMFKVKH